MSVFEIVKDVLAVIGLGFILIYLDAYTTKFIKFDEEREPDF